MWPYHARGQLYLVENNDLGINKVGWNPVCLGKGLWDKNWMDIIIKLLNSLLTDHRKDKILLQTHFLRVRPPRAAFREHESISSKQRQKFSFSLEWLCHTTPNIMITTFVARLHLSNMHAYLLKPAIFPIKVEYYVKTSFISDRIYFCRIFHTSGKHGI